MAREIMYGPIQFNAIAFNDTNVIEDLIEELYLVREVGIIRLIDFMFIAKDEDGEIIILDVSDFTKEERITFGAVVGGLIGLGAGGEEGARAGAELGALAVSENDFGLLGDDILEVIEDIPNGSSVCLTLFEHTWAKGLKQAVVNHDGIMLAQGLIHPYALVAVGAALGDAVRDQEKWEHEQMLQEQAQTKKKGTSTKDLNAKSETKTTKAKPKVKKIEKKK